MVKLDGSVGSCNTFNDFSNKACVPNKTEDLKSMCIQQDQSIYCLSVNVNLMEENVSQINGRITINVAECKQCHVCEKYCVWNSAACSCENGKYLASIMDDSVIRCNEIIESFGEETNFNEKKTICKTQNFYILLTFLLITIALLIAASTYCYLIKHQANEKHLLPF